MYLLSQHYVLNFDSNFGNSFIKILIVLHSTKGHYQTLLWGTGLAMSCLVNITYINNKKYQYYQQISISVLKSKYSNLREFQNIIQSNNVEFNNFFGQKTYINFEI